METLSQAASAASRAIWGDPASQPAGEPESGRTGEGTKSDPYDGGNATEQSENAIGDNTASTNKSLVAGDSENSGLPKPSVGNSESSTLPTESSNQNAPGAAQASGGPITSHHDQDKTGVTDMHSTDATHSSKPTSNANESSVADRGQAKAPIGGVGAVEPSVSADPASGAQNTEKQQGADRPTEEPTNGQTDAIKEKKDKAEDAMDEDKLEDGADDGAPKPNKDPNDHSGEPLGTVDHSGKSEEKEEGHTEGGGPLGGDKSKEEGTGEKWIKTSGVEADGGNFDAAQAGAAKEADRLLEQKGVHRSGDNTGEPETGDDANGASVDPGKPSIGKKIKEKLHIGKKTS